MTAAATLPRGTATLRRIPLAEIDTADNVRASIDPAADAELAASIKAVGILQPVTLWETPLGRYQVRYGHRRVRAARLAGLTHVPALVSEDAALETRVVEQLVENLQRSDLSALEEANALRAILDSEKGLTQAALAQRIGRSAPWVANTLGLLKLPPEVQQLLADRKLEASHGKAIAGLPAAAQVRLATDAAENGLSAHMLEERARWDRERAADLAKRAKETAAAASRAIEALTAADTPKDGTLFVTVPWHLDGDAVRAAIAEAGWRTDGGYFHWKPAKGCDCTSLVVTVQDGKGTTIERTCSSQAHRDAREAEIRTAQQRKSQEAAAEASELTAAIGAALRQDAGDPVVMRLVLRRLDGYSAKPWDEYVKRSDDDVLDALARALVPPSYESTPLPVKAVLNALPGPGAR